MWRLVHSHCLEVGLCLKAKLLSLHYCCIEVLSLRHQTNEQKGLEIQTLCKHFNGDELLHESEDLDRKEAKLNTTGS